MDRLVQVDRDQLSVELGREVEQLLGRVMDAVNAARDGRLVEDSEGPVLELMRDFQRRAFERALQLRVDSTESSFSPAQGRGVGQAQAEQGPVRVVAADPAGPGVPVPHAVRRPGGRRRGRRQ